MKSTQECLDALNAGYVLKEKMRGYTVHLEYGKQVITNKRRRGRPYKFDSPWAFSIIGKLPIWKRVLNKIVKKISK